MGTGASKVKGTWQPTYTAAETSADYYDYAVNAASIPPLPPIGGGQLPISSYHRPSMSALKPPIGPPPAAAHSPTSMGFFSPGKAPQPKNPVGFDRFNPAVPEPAGQRHVYGGYYWVRLASGAARPVEPVLRSPSVHSPSPSSASATASQSGQPSQPQSASVAPSETGGSGLAASERARTGSVVSFGVSQSGEAPVPTQYTETAQQQQQPAIRDRTYSSAPAQSSATLPPAAAITAVSVGESLSPAKAAHQFQQQQQQPAGEDAPYVWVYVGQKGQPALACAGSFPCAKCFLDFPSESQLRLHLIHTHRVDPENFSPKASLERRFSSMNTVGSPIPSPQSQSARADPAAPDSDAVLSAAAAAAAGSNGIPSHIAAAAGAPVSTGVSRPSPTQLAARTILALSRPESPVKLSNQKQHEMIDAAARKAALRELDLGQAHQRSAVAHLMHAGVPGAVKATLTIPAGLTSTLTPAASIFSAESSARSSPDVPATAYVPFSTATATSTSSLTASSTAAAAVSTSSSTVMGPSASFTSKLGRDQFGRFETRMFSLAETATGGVSKGVSRSLSATDAALNTHAALSAARASSTIGGSGGHSLPVPTLQVCPTCARVVSSATELHDHEAAAHGVGPRYSCRVGGCQRKFEQVSQLRLHMRAIHGLLLR